MSQLLADLITFVKRVWKHSVTFVKILYVTRDETNSSLTRVRFQEPNVLVPQSNVILTALVYGMRKEETNDNVRLAATTAMLNSLEFTKNNFQNDVRRTARMLLFRLRVARLE